MGETLPLLWARLGEVARPLALIAGLFVLMMPRMEDVSGLVLPFLGGGMIAGIIAYLHHIKDILVSSEVLGQSK